MAANLTIDKIFADNLGTAFGGCVRDQSLNLFSPEIARSAGANWNPLPFFGRAEKVRFRARWAALLQGIGLWAALVVIPELKADPKLHRWKPIRMHSSRRRSLTICRPTKSVITHCFASASCVLALRQAPSLTRMLLRAHFFQH